MSVYASFFLLLYYCSACVLTRQLFFFMPCFNQNELLKHSDVQLRAVNQPANQPADSGKRLGKEILFMRKATPKYTTCVRGKICSITLTKVLPTYFCYLLCFAIVLWHLKYISFKWTNDKCTKRATKTIFNPRTIIINSTAMMW